MSNAMPCCKRQRHALARAVRCQLSGGLGAVASELRRWRRAAEEIPDRRLRADALNALGAKRGHIDGAALFWTLPGDASPELLRLLVAYAVLYDYLDEVGERVARERGAIELSTYRALVDALAPDAAPGDDGVDDGGYLRALVECCRAGCRALPGFTVVAPLIAHDTSRIAVVAANHDVSDERRDASLAAWARRARSERLELLWFESTAAASHIVAVLALLSIAVDLRVTRAQAEALHSAYDPWFGLAGTMLDSYVDQAEDRASGAHSYIGHYPDHETAVARLCESVERSAERLLALPDGERHAVLLGCMVAMYLSKNSAWTPELRRSTIRICRSGGTLATILLPILRVWRIANRQTSAT